MPLPELTEVDAWLMESYQWLRSRLAQGVQLEMFRWRADAAGLPGEAAFEAWHRLMLLDRYILARRRSERLQAQSINGYVMRALEDLVDG